MKTIPVLLLSRELGLGGSERQLCEIAKSLDRSRFEPHVGCFHSKGFRAEELRAASVPVVEFPVRSFLSASVWKGASQLGKYVRAHGIRLVHSFDVPMNLFGAPWARFFGVEAVLTSQRAHRALTPGLMHHLLRMTDIIADAVVVNSQAVRRQLIEEDRTPRGKIRVCYNGIDPTLFHPAPAERPAALDGAELVIGVVCAFRPEKGLDTLLEAFARVRYARQGLKLLLVGGGPVQPELERKAAALGIASDCVFAPPVTDVARWLRAIDIFVLPSLSEAFSNSLMEAMACGCCVAASDVGGNPELVTPGSTGLLFRAGDPEDLAASLRLLIEGDELRRRLAAAASEYVLREFSQRRAASCMEEIYAEFLGMPAASAM